MHRFFHHICYTGLDAALPSDTQCAKRNPHHKAEIRPGRIYRNTADLAEPIDCRGTKGPYDDIPHHSARRQDQNRQPPENGTALLHGKEAKQQPKQKIGSELKNHQTDAQPGRKQKIIVAK